MLTRHNVNSHKRNTSLFVGRKRSRLFLFLVWAEQYRELISCTEAIISTSLRMRSEGNPCCWSEIWAIEGWVQDFSFQRRHAGKDIVLHKLKAKQIPFSTKEFYQAKNQIERHLKRRGEYMSVWSRHTQKNKTKQNKTNKQTTTKNKQQQPITTQNITFKWRSKKREKPSK